MAAGAVLLLFGSEAPAATAPDPGRGNLMALAAGATWALTITGLRWMGKHADHTNDSAAATVIAGNLIAFAVCLPMAIPVDHASLCRRRGSALSRVFQIALAYVFLTRSLREVPGLEAATLLLIEPVFNPIWTWMIHGERPGHRAAGRPADYYGRVRRDRLATETVSGPERTRMTQEPRPEYPLLYC